MDQGLAVTWDNPDIAIFDGGVAVDSSAVEPDHPYDVRVRVWNGSYSAPALRMPVTLTQLDFGINTTSTTVGEDHIDLGAKGTPEQPAFAHFAWRTPAEPGHYCLQAQLHWDDDANPNNNLGQENVLIGEAASPARFTFRLRNTASVRQRFVLEADSYQLSARTCDEEDQRPLVGDDERPTRIDESRRRWAWAMRTQAYGQFPVPEGWSVLITPSEPVVDAGEQLEVEVVIEPDVLGFSGTVPFNIHGFALGPGNTRRLVGGVTLKVKSPRP